jgi:hypothetical protein
VQRPNLEAVATKHNGPPQQNIGGQEDIVGVIDEAKHQKNAQRLKEMRAKRERDRLLEEEEFELTPEIS